MKEFSSPAEASNWLKEGKILIHPTEGVWGLGCDASNIKACEKIALLKQRYLCFKRAIFSHAFIFDASQPRPHTPSVGWIKILPSFSQFDASAGDENSFK